MKRHLLLLNVILLALVVWAGAVLRQQWEQARRREDALLKRRLPTIAVPEVAPLPSPAGARPAQYVDIAQRVLFSRDRNPVVIVEPVKPPPPKMLPPLPRVHGILQFGDESSVVLSEKAGAEQKTYHPGQDIGPFRLLAVNDTHILLEWEGLRVLRRLEDLAAKDAAPGGSSTASAGGQKTEAPRAAVVSAPAAPSSIALGGEAKACAPGDNSPSGTVSDGMRKVVTATPFGNQCRWEPAR